MSTAVSRARLRTAVFLGLLSVTVGLPSWADTSSDAPPKKDRRGILLRLELMERVGGGGWLVAIETISETGKTAEFDSTPGYRVGAEVELGSGIWFKTNIGRSTPTLVVTTHDPGGPEVVQRATVRMTPFLVGFEFHPKQWRDERWFWGVGIHYGWVSYGSLPSGIDADLESTENAGGFDLRLDVRLGKTPWLIGAEFGGFFANPRLTDHATGIARSAHFEGVLWSVGFSRQF